MKIEEAIQWFSYRVEDAKKALESYSEDDTAEGFKMVAKFRLESAKMALAALRAQQEAEKNENGCKYCRDGDVIALDSCSAVRIERDGQNYVMGGCDWEREINYCPMCGRQLRHPPKAERKS